MKHFYLLLFVLSIYGCNFRIYSNGKKTDKVKPDNKNWKSSNESCFVFHISDTLPDSLVYINTTTIKTPFVWINPASPNNVLTEVAKTEAGKIGANVIQVVDYGGFNYSFSVKMYRQPNSLWNELKNQKELNEIARNKQNENWCVVHVRCFYNVRGPLYFNDSLIGGFKKTKEKDAFHLLKTLDFRFPSQGTLSPGKLSNLNSRIKGKPLSRGKEYYFELDTSKYGNYLHLIDKDDYY